MLANWPELGVMVVGNVMPSASRALPMGAPCPVVISILRGRSAATAACISVTVSPIKTASKGVTCTSNAYIIWQIHRQLKEKKKWRLLLCT